MIEGNNFNLQFANQMIDISLIRMSSFDWFHDNQDNPIIDALII